MALRVAAFLGGQPDAVNYYTGGYFYAVGSLGYKKYWDRLLDNPVYAPFVEMKIAEIAGNPREVMRGLNSILRKSPLFMPAIVKLWMKNMQDGRESDALRILNRALLQSDVPNAGRAYLLKLRAHVFYIFGDYDEAEQDAAAAATLAPLDAGIMGLLAKVWAAKKSNLDEAYRYAISLIKAFPSSVESWDVLAMVVRAKEGDGEALEILERVGRVAEECSELFMHLGDLRALAGLIVEAEHAYRKSVALSDDGLVVRGEVERKLRKLK
jgi:tetratricopeptide (TPR) repeat protein